MVDILRPDYGQVWASEGEKVSPVEDKVKLGWVQEMMPFQWENFLQARQDEAITYLLQKGIPEYAATQEYTANKSVVQYQGNLYLATATVTGVLPIVTASWRRLSPTLASNGTVSVAGGGTGATSAAQARANLGLGDASTATLPTATGVVVKGVGETLISRLLTGTSGDIVITNPDGVAGNINIGVGGNVAKTNQDSSWTSKGGITLPRGSSSERGVEVPGKIRYNTGLQKFEGYNGTSWDALGAASEVEITTLSGDGTTTVFTLNTPAFSEANTDVYVGGVWQNKGTYSISEAQITFSEAPTPGTENVQVISRKVVDLGLARASQISLEDSANLITATTVEGALREIVETSGTITTSAEWASVPSHSNPKLDLQAKALANRVEWLRDLQARKTLREFGAVGDYISDDTDAVVAAIASGSLLDWENRVYRITREIQLEVNHAIDWVSAGAVIKLDTGTHQYACLHLKVGEFKHVISGVLDIDASKKANVGFRAYPIVDSASPDFLAEDLSIRNVHRTPAFNDGDAIFLDRGWGTVTLVRPKIRDLTMAVGAGVAGVYGIFGITVSRGGSGGVYAAKCVNIVHPDIDGIWSEDPAYVSDQDAIRVFTRYGGSATGGKQNEMTFTILGGVVKDVRGRSVKGQTEKGGVDGLSVIRTTRASAGVEQRLNSNADIELQTGGGFIRNIEFSYSGFVPNVVARIIQADFTIAYSTPPIISDINGTVTGSISPRTAVTFSLADSSTTGPGSDKSFNVMTSNVNIVAETPFENSIDLTRSGATSNSFNLIAANYNVPVTGYFINNLSNTAASNGKILVTNALNPATTSVDLLRTVAGFDCIAENIIGINYNSAQPNRIVRGKKSVIGEYATGFSSESPLVVGRGTSLAAVADLSSRIAIFQRNGASIISVIADQFGAAGLTLGSPSVYNNFGLYVNQPDGATPFGYVSIVGNPRVRFSDTALEPYVNNGISFGTATRRISEVFATNGTINTSDARLKTQPEDIPQALLDAISEVTPRWWQWLASVETKGADARWFAGPMAQDLRDALVRRGLMQEGSTSSPWAGLCYDEWDDEFVPVLAERINAEGEVEEYDTGETRLITAAGNAWSVRHDQVLYVMLCAMQRKLESLTERLNALEERD